MRRSRSTDEAARGANPARSLPLLWTGGLMLLTPFVLANRWFGTLTEAWPWEQWAGEGVPLREAALAGLWCLAALWALLLGVRGPVRLRALGLAGLAALLLLETRLGGPPWSLESVSLAMLLPVVALGAGLWLAREGDTRSFGRLLAGIGGVLVVWTLAASFDHEATRLSAYFSDMEALFRDWRGDFAPPHRLWTSLLPQTLLLLTAVYGLLVWMGVSTRRTTTVFFCLLLAALLLPALMEAFSRQDGSTADEGPIARLLEHLLAHGALLWLLAVFAVADLVRLRASDRGRAAA